MAGAGRDDFSFQAHRFKEFRMRYARFSRIDINGAAEFDHAVGDKRRD